MRNYEKCKYIKYMYLGLMAVEIWCNKKKRRVDNKECKKCKEGELKDLIMEQDEQG